MYDRGGILERCNVLEASHEGLVVRKNFLTSSPGRLANLEQMKNRIDASGPSNQSKTRRILPCPGLLGKPHRA